MFAKPPRHWAVGERVEALDEMGTWYEAAVVAERGADESRELRVHYKGWNSRRDEWIGASSNRVRPTGGVLGTKVDLSVKWETGLDGMRSSTGEATVLWRAWETFEQNLARGVKPESMGKSWGGK